MIHKRGTIRWETFLQTVTQGNKNKSTLHSSVGSVSILYETVFTDILCTFSHVIIIEYQTPVIKVIHTYDRVKSVSPHSEMTVQYIPNV